MAAAWLTEQEQLCLVAGILTKKELSQHSLEVYGAFITKVTDRSCTLHDTVVSAARDRALRVRAASLGC